MVKKILLLLIAVSLCVSCSKSEVASENKTLNIWYYIEAEDYSSIGQDAVDSIVKYAENNNIQENVTCIDGNTISYDDYVLKRNLAMASGKIDILVDYPRNMYTVRNESGDYSRLNTYDNILDNFKGGFCVPVAVRNFARILDGRVFSYYGIDVGKVIGAEEYYAAKQQLKSLGAEFELNEQEMTELISYYIKQYDSFTKEDGKFTVNRNGIKSAIKAICEDLTENYSQFNNEKIKVGHKEIRDVSSGITVYDRNMGYGNVSKFGLISLMLNEHRDNINDDTVFYLTEPSTDVTSIFIYKDAPQTAYDAVSVIFESSFITSSTNDLSSSSPIINTPQVREYLNVDENWQYNGYMKSDPNEDDKIALELFNACGARMLTYDFGYIFDNLGAVELYRDFLIDSSTKLMMGELEEDELDSMISDFEINLNIVAE